ncbi:adenylate/guanylate cyclase domain-containing protein [bacterium]|nr:adenylate/guanylate cyclase domain-containing protein [bacterium]
MVNKILDIDIYKQLLLDSAINTFVIIILVVNAVMFLILKLYNNKLNKKLSELEKKTSGNVISGDKASQDKYFQIREKELMELERKSKIEFTQKMVRMNSIIYRFRELASSLDENEIFKVVAEIISKSANARSGYFFLNDEKEGDIYCVRGFRHELDENGMDSYELFSVPNLTFAISEDDALGYIALNSGVLCKSDQKSDIEVLQLLKRCPINFEVLFSIVSRKKVVGVISIEEFIDPEKKEISTEEKQIIISVGAVLGVVLKNAQLLDLTKKDLVSTKKISDQEREMKLKLKEMFGKYTSSSLVETIMDNPNSVKLGGEIRKMTVLFSDIKGFTSFSEKNPPEKVISCLNEYLDAITNVILETGGTIDKFMGDAVMAFWGAPVFVPNHAEKAVEAALAMQELITELNEIFKDQEGDFNGFEMGVGINTGEMIVGNIGSSERLEYTVIGDAVNVASRLESLTRSYESNIIISNGTYDEIADSFECEFLESVQVKGRSQAVEIYGLKS